MPKTNQTSIHRQTARVRRDTEHALRTVGPEGLDFVVKLITQKPRMSKREMVRRLIPYALVRKEASHATA
jgi:hypothetical protein